MRRVLWATLSLSATLASCREPTAFDAGDDEVPIDVAAIQTPHGAEVAPAVGEKVFLRSVVVTAADAYAEPRQRRDEAESGGYVCVEEAGYTGAIVVQDVAAGPYSGVALFNPVLISSELTVGPGDLVDVRARYVEFCLSGQGNVADSFCEAQDTHRLTQLDQGSVTKVGEASQPEPIVVTAAQLRDERIAEQYEGVLVRLNERINILPCQPTDSRGNPACCCGDYDRYGDLDTDVIALTNEFYSIPEGIECLDSVTGIVTWFGHATDWGDYKISPRGPDDIVVGSACD